MHTTYTQRLLSGLALSGLLLASAHAQTLGSLAAAPAAVKVGEPVSVTATVDVSGSNYCGFIVFFGDGTSVEGVSDVNTPNPLVVSHTYAKAGSYTLSMGGRHVQSHPNCGGADLFATVKVEAATPAASAKASAASVCPAPWKLVPKSFNTKTQAFACSAKPGTALPTAKVACANSLTYYENKKKGQLGCRP